MFLKSSFNCLSCGSSDDRNLSITIVPINMFTRCLMELAAIKNLAPLYYSSGNEQKVREEGVDGPSSSVMKWSGVGVLDSQPQPR